MESAWQEPCSLTACTVQRTEASHTLQAPTFRGKRHGPIQRTRGCPLRCIEAASQLPWYLPRKVLRSQIVPLVFRKHGAVALVVPETLLLSSQRVSQSYTRELGQDRPWRGDENHSLARSSCLDACLQRRMPRADQTHLWAHKTMQRIAKAT